MKIHVIGNNAAAKKLGEYLENVGYRVTRFGAAYTIRVEDGAEDRILLEGVESQLAAEAQTAIAELAGVPVRFKKADRGSDRELCVFAGGSGTDAVERGVLRALLRITEHGEPQASGARGWLKKLLG